MAEDALSVEDGPVWRAGLVRKHRLLRGVAGAAALTPRAARFAVQMRPAEPLVTLADLARLPVWRLDPAWDSDRLAEIAGLLAMRQVLLRTVAGPLLRELADRYTPDLFEAVLEADLPDTGPADTSWSLDAAALRQAGQALLDRPGDSAARSITDTALQLLAAEGRIAQ